MNIKNILKQFLIVSTVFIATISCDKDFISIGSDVVRDEHFGFLKYDGASVIAYTNGYGAIQSNNLPINSLGVYNNPIFGQTKTNFVTQVELVSAAPTFDLTLQQSGQVVLDSVILSIPYFDKVASRVRNTTGSVTYALDSINGSGPIDLKVFENGFYLNDLDPTSGFQSPQKYFSDQDNTFNSLKGQQLNDGIASENTNFEFSPKEYVVKKRDESLAFISPVEAESRLTPRMIMHLNKAFFQSKMFTNATASNLSSNSEFKKYFRGLYFQVANAASGSSSRINFAGGTITMYWKEYAGLKVDPNDATKKIPITYTLNNVEVTKYLVKSLALNLTGNTVSLIDQTNSPSYGAVQSAAPNTTTGDNKLYLKGGPNGNVVLLDLFKDIHGADGVSGAPNGIPDSKDMKNSGWLINEANLVFNVDNAMVGTTAPDPFRLYVYNSTNRRPVIDYLIDNSTGISAIFNKLIYGGIAQYNTATPKRSQKYKIRITNHIRNIIEKDSINVKLGVSVSEFVGFGANIALKTPNAIDRIPMTGGVNPFGTILYGSLPIAGGSAQDEEKRLKLEIYYTKPN